MSEVWAFITRHARLAVEARNGLADSATRNSERGTIHSLRGRLMAYSRGLPGGRNLRVAFAKLESLKQLDDIARTTWPASRPKPATAADLAHSGTPTTLSM